MQQTNLFLTSVISESKKYDFNATALVDRRKFLF